jgi:hypothetical protein
MSRAHRSRVALTITGGSWLGQVAALRLGEAGER